MGRTMKGISRRLAALALVAGVVTGALGGSAGASTPAGGPLCTAFKKYVAVVTKARGAADTAHAQRYAKDTYKVLKKVKDALPGRFDDDIDTLRDQYKAAQSASSVEDYLSKFTPESIAAAEAIGKYVSKRCDVR